MSGSRLPDAQVRLVPDARLPPYSYVTGRFPHPTRDPAGHSFGHAPAAPARVDPACWNQSRDYLIGFDLFNGGYYWEAHELWEGLWHACGRHGTTADFLKALIKLAAAGVKAREGRFGGVKRHAARAAELFVAVRTTERDYLGLDLDWLIGIARGLQSATMPAPGDGPVEIVFDFRLVPSADRCE